MKYKKMNGVYYIRVDANESVNLSLLKVCKKENIYGGYFQGIGGCDRVTISTYIPERNDFIDHPIEGMIEMVSLQGNISKGSDGEPFFHSHGTFSFLDKLGEVSVIAGHVKEIHISYTGEITMHPAKETINRKIDSVTGIEVWDL